MSFQEKSVSFQEKVVVTHSDSKSKQNKTSTFAVHAAFIRGVDAIPVTVEVSASGSIPGISIVGMADSTVQEARSRIRCALRSSGFVIPRNAFTVNLAPSDMRKTGAGFDLPIAIAVLALSNQISRNNLDKYLFVAELGLDGAVCSVKGEVAYQILAREMGLTLVSGRSDAHILLDGAQCGHIDILKDLREGIDDAIKHTSIPKSTYEPTTATLDFSDVIGQEIAKRGMVVAATGGLGLLMVGAPGSGKSMLARRMTGILPPIEKTAQQEALCIHSVLGEKIDGLLAGERPFRSPHHSISAAGLVGGGRPVRPGEISLAHGGVLFLDELAEFSNHNLQMLRQPMEEKRIRIVRVDGNYEFAADFQLVAASNPCPCGYLGDREIICRCSDASVEHYQQKLGGPLADRIDVVLNVIRPEAETMLKGSEGLSTAAMRSQVEKGLAFSIWRKQQERLNVSQSPNSSLDTAISSFIFDSQSETTLLDLAHKKRLTGRGIVRLSRIARTIADLSESEKIQRDHVLEASQLQGR